MRALEHCKWLYLLPFCHPPSTSDKSSAIERIEDTRAESVLLPRMISQTVHPGIALRLEAQVRLRAYSKRHVHGDMEAKSANRPVINQGVLCVTGNPADRGCCTDLSTDGEKRGRSAGPSVSARQPNE